MTLSVQMVHSIDGCGVPPSRCIVFIPQLCVFRVYVTSKIPLRLECNYLSDSDRWLKYWPSAFVGTIKPNCQPSSLPVDTTTATNNSALSWTITNVTLHSVAKDTLEPLSSLVYQSNYLENCQFRSVTIYLDSYLGGRNAPQISWSTWGAEVEGRMYCEVQNSGLGVTYVNLTAGYTLLPPSAFENNEMFQISGRDPSLYSLWWGEPLYPRHGGTLSTRWPIIAQLQASSPVSSVWNPATPWSRRRLCWSLGLISSGVSRRQQIDVHRRPSGCSILDGYQHVCRQR